MSSFRIDRQYVSFETAETQTVYAQRHEPVPVEHPAAPGDDINRLYNEIYERLQQEHAEQAETMLQKAKEEAQEIIDRAKREASDMLSAAQDESDRRCAETEQALAAAEAERKSDEANRLLQMESDLQSRYKVMVEQMRGDFVTLVMDITKKIIGYKLDESDAVFLNLIKDALERLKQTGTITIRVSPQDYARYFGAERPELEPENSDARIVAVEDPAFKPGDLVVESDGEVVDISIDRQLDLIEQAFSN
ncbi:FliH/SctL family protein [Oscillospiraceae bacterium WX1]